MISSFIIYISVSKYMNADNLYIHLFLVFIIAI